MYERYLTVNLVNTQIGSMQYKYMPTSPNPMVKASNCEELLGLLDLGTCRVS